MNVPPTGACQAPPRSAVRLVLLIAAACLGASAVVTLVFCGPRVL